MVSSPYSCNFFCKCRKCNVRDTVRDTFANIQYKNTELNKSCEEGKWTKRKRGEFLVGNKVKENAINGGNQCGCTVKYKE